MADRGGSDDGREEARKRKEAEQRERREAREVHAASREAAKKHGFSAEDPDGIAVAAKAKRTDLQKAIAQARAARNDYQQAAARLKEQERLIQKDREPWQEELDRRERDLAAKEQRVKDEAQRLREQSIALEDREGKIGSAESTLREQGKRLEQLELEIKEERTNAAILKAADLADVDRARAKLREQLEAHVAEFARKLSETASAQEQEHGKGLAEWSARLAREQEELDQQRRALKDESQRLDARREHIEAEVGERLGDEIRAIKEQNEQLTGENEHLAHREDEIARKARDLEDEVRKHERSQELIEQMTPLEAVETIRAQRAKIAELEGELDVRPTEQTQERIGDLLLANQRLKDELSTMRVELDERGRRLSEFEHAVASDKQLVEEVETFKALNETYLAQNAELRQALGSDRAAASFPFPRLTELDGKLEDLPAAELPQAPRLDELAAGLGMALAAGDERHPQLYYTDHDIRAFIAGMAMSRLHILEGDSGTGKTSLAVRATELLGGHVAKIDVQAGWRDSERLLGAYNTFERRFEEEPFTVAVYRAGAPPHTDQLFVVVLDEMNLSSVEYYFADLSPKLEDAVRDPKPIELELMVSSPPGGKDTWPRRLQGGRVLTVPDNVWFIGTANRDESTHTIADKTYDRAAILQLERAGRDPQTVPDGGYAEGRLHVGFGSLKQRFEEAQSLHGATGMKDLWNALELIDVSLKDFSLRWSPRFVDHVEKFVPVYIACGGKAADAADHLLATKVLRRLRDRYGNRKSELEGLKEGVSVAWEMGFGKEATPQRSLEALEAASQRAMIE